MRRFRIRWARLLLALSLALNAFLALELEALTPLPREHLLLQREHTRLRAEHDHLRRSAQEVADLVQRESVLAEARQRRQLGQHERLTTLTASLEQDLADLRQEYAKTRRELREKELLIAMAEADGVGFVDLEQPPVPAIDTRVIDRLELYTVGGLMARDSGGEDRADRVLLGAGADDGVETGYHFSVYRGDRFVGKVVVERVERDTCRARVLFLAEGQQIQSGDAAATRLH